MGLIIMFYNLIHSLFTGREAGDNPWEAASLEWQTTSPPPTENFDEQPVVTKGPYDFK
jgi:cytochrome c oxidase subunit 1